MMQTTFQAICYKLLHLFTTWTPKLQILVHSFTAWQKCRATLESCSLQTRLVYLCLTYAVTLPIWVRLLRPIENAELPPQARPWTRKWKIFENQVSLRQKINRFLSAFVFFCFSPHFLFFFIFLLENKSNASNNHKPHIKKREYLPLPYFLYIKPCHGRPKNSFKKNLLAPSFFLYVIQHTSVGWTGPSISPASTIFKTLSLILCYLDELYALAIEKTKVEREA